MIVYNITDFRAFFDTLDECRDDVTIIAPDGTAYDYRENRPFLRSFFRTLSPTACNRLELKLADPASVDKLLCYLLTKDHTPTRLIA